MLVFPNAKINLGLNVTSRRADGYHNIESLFYPIGLCDALEVIEDKTSTGISISFSGIPVSGNAESNLCVKAFRIFRHRFGTGGVRCHLHKNIPLGAGLGGGSADGTFMLKALNELFNLLLPDEELKSLALELGSDCAYFIYNLPAFVSGRGEVIEPADFTLRGKHLVVIQPEIHVSTINAYSLITPETPLYDIREVATLPPNEWRQNFINDFEKPVAGLHPEISILKDKLYACGAFYASMTGSGSAVYGLFDATPEIPECEFKNHFVYSEVM